MVKVAERHGDGVRYKVEYVKEPGKLRILHRNMLISIGHTVEPVDDKVRHKFLQ